MEEKRIRKLNKKELLEILLSQARRIEELELELENCNKKLASKKLMIDEVGSIAEACLSLNGIFEAAQASVDQYMSNIYDRCKKMENDTEKECQKLKEETLAYVVHEKEKVDKLSLKKEGKGSIKEKSKTIKRKSTKMVKRRKVHS